MPGNLPLLPGNSPGQEILLRLMNAYREPANQFPMPPWTPPVATEGPAAVPVPGQTARAIRPAQPQQPIDPRLLAAAARAAQAERQPPAQPAAPDPTVPTAPVPIGAGSGLAGGIGDALRGYSNVGNATGLEAFAAGYTGASDSRQTREDRKRQEAIAAEDRAIAAEERTYDRSRDAAGDARYDDKVGYERGRDTKADAREDVRLAREVKIDELRQATAIMGLDMSALELRKAERTEAILAKQNGVTPEMKQKIGNDVDAALETIFGDRGAIGTTDAKGNKITAAENYLSMRKQLLEDRYREIGIGGEAGADVPKQAPKGAAPAAVQSLPVPPGMSGEAPAPAPGGPIGMGRGSPMPPMKLPDGMGSFEKPYDGIKKGTFEQMRAAGQALPSGTYFIDPITGQTKLRN